MKVNLISLLLSGVGLISSVGHCQLKPVGKLPLEHVRLASVDRLGNFYFVLPDNRLQSYSPEVVLQNETVLDGPAVTLIEPWNPLKIFLYSRQEQAYRFYDRKLSLLEAHALDPSLSIEPLLVCPAQEVNKIWILDSVEGFLKKIDEASLAIDLEAKLPVTGSSTNHDYIFMRAYQNRLFLLDGKVGIYIFNNLGKLITTIHAPGLGFFNFLGEELCYRRGKEILLFDIYTGAERKVADLEEEEPILFTLITDERLLVVTNRGISFYQYELKD